MTGVIILLAIALAAVIGLAFAAIMICNPSKATGATP